jgi:hypothetical protein
LTPPSSCGSYAVLLPLSDRVELPDGIRSAPDLPAAPPGASGGGATSNLRASRASAATYLSAAVWPVTAISPATARRELDPEPRPILRVPLLPNKELAAPAVALRPLRPPHSVGERAPEGAAHSLRVARDAEARDSRLGGRGVLGRVRYRCSVIARS